MDRAFWVLALIAFMLTGAPPPCLGDETPAQPPPEDQQQPPKKVEDSSGTNAEIERKKEVESRKYQKGLEELDPKGYKVQYDDDGKRHTYRIDPDGKWKELSAEAQESLENYILKGGKEKFESASDAYDAAAEAGKDASVPVETKKALVEAWTENWAALRDPTSGNPFASAQDAREAAKRAASEHEFGQSKLLAKALDPGTQPGSAEARIEGIFPRPSSAIRAEIETKIKEAKETDRVKGPVSARSPVTPAEPERPREAKPDPRQEAYAEKSRKLTEAQATNARGLIESLLKSKDLSLFNREMLQRQLKNYDAAMQEKDPAKRFPALRSTLNQTSNFLAASDMPAARGYRNLLQQNSQSQLARALSLDLLAASVEKSRPGMGDKVLQFYSGKLDPKEAPSVRQLIGELQKNRDPALKSFSQANWAAQKAQTGLDTLFKGSPFMGRYDAGARALQEFHRANLLAAPDGTSFYAHELGLSGLLPNTQIQKVTQEGRPGILMNSGKGVEEFSSLDGTLSHVVRKDASGAVVREIRIQRDSPGAPPRVEVGERDGSGEWVKRPGELTPQGAIRVKLDESRSQVLDAKGEPLSSNFKLDWFAKWMSQRASDGKNAGRIEDLARTVAEARGLKREQADAYAKLLAGFLQRKYEEGIGVDDAMLAALGKGREGIGDLVRPKDASVMLSLDKEGRVHFLVGTKEFLYAETASMGPRTAFTPSGHPHAFVEGDSPPADAGKDALVTTRALYNLRNPELSMASAKRQEEYFQDGSAVSRLRWSELTDKIPAFGLAGREHNETSVFLRYDKPASPGEPGRHGLTLKGRWTETLGTSMLDDASKWIGGTPGFKQVNDFLGYYGKLGYQVGVGGNQAAVADNLLSDPRAKATFEVHSMAALQRAQILQEDSSPEQQKQYWLRLARGLTPEQREVADTRVMDLRLQEMAKKGETLERLGAAEYARRLHERITDEQRAHALSQTGAGFYGDELAADALANKDARMAVVAGFVDAFEKNSQSLPQLLLLERFQALGKLGAPSSPALAVPLQSARIAGTLYNLHMTAELAPQVAQQLADAAGTDWSDPYQTKEVVANALNNLPLLLHGAKSVYQAVRPPGAPGPAEPGGASPRRTPGALPADPPGRAQQGTPPGETPAAESGAESIRKQMAQDLVSKNAKKTFAKSRLTPDDAVDAFLKGNPKVAEALDRYASAVAGEDHAAVLDAMKGLRQSLASPDVRFDGNAQRLGRLQENLESVVLKRQVSAMVEKAGVRVPGPEAWADVMKQPDFVRNAQLAMDLARSGHSVEFVARGEGKTPDLMVNGERLEIKAVQGKDIARSIREGVKQANGDRLLIDLSGRGFSVEEAQQALVRSKEYIEKDLGGKYPEPKEVLLLAKDGQVVRGKVGEPGTVGKWEGIRLEEPGAGPTEQLADRGGSEGPAGRGAQSPDQGALQGRDLPRMSLVDRLTLGRSPEQMARIESLWSALNEINASLDKPLDVSFQKSAGAGAWKLVLENYRSGQIADAKTAAVTLLAASLGFAAQIPVEIPATAEGRLTGVSASGHSTLNPFSAALALAQLGKGANKPGHETTHAVMYALLAGAVEKGLLTKDQAFDVMNSKVYLWGGPTEKAAVVGEKTGSLAYAFEALRHGGRELFFRERLGPRELAEAGRRYEALAAHLSEIQNRLGEADPSLAAVSPELLQAMRKDLSGPWEADASGRYRSLAAEQWSRYIAQKQGAEPVAGPARPGTGGLLDRLGLGRTQSPPAERPQDVLTNRMGGADVAKRLGVVRDASKGPLLSDPQKSSTQVREVETRDGGRFIEKVFKHPEEAHNELFMRQVVKTFFGDVFDVPDAAGYLRGGPFSKEAVLLMEKSPGTVNHHQFSQLSLEQKAALAVLRGTFGLEDMNSGGMLFGGKRPTLIDMELAGGAVQANTRLLPSEMTLADRPWVSRFYLNDLADYQPAIDRWRTQFQLPETQRALEGMMREAGMGSSRAAAELRNFSGNAGRLEEVLRADIDAANAFFLKEAERAGLTPEQAGKLSALNKAAHAGPRDSGPRDAVRLLNARIAAESGAKDPSALRRGEGVLAPEELAFLLDGRHGGLSPADRAALNESGASEGLEGLERLAGLVDRAAREAELVHDLKNAMIPSRGWLLRASRMFGAEAPAELRRDVGRAVDLGQTAESLSRELMDRLRAGFTDPRAVAEMSRRLKGTAEKLDSLHRKIIGRFEELAGHESPDWKWKPSQLAEILRDSAQQAEIISAELWGGAPAKGRGPAPVRDSVVSALARTRAVLSDRGVQWTLDMRVGDGTRIGDPAALDRALSNLILNAADAMEGSLAKNLEVRVHESPDARRLRVEVSDTGPGMGPELLENVRSGRSFTTKGPDKGSGVGLPSVRAAVLESGGTFEVESSPGKGAIFRIELPLGPAKRP